MNKLITSVILLCVTFSLGATNTEWKKLSKKEWLRHKDKISQFWNQHEYNVDFTFSLQDSLNPSRVETYSDCFMSKRDDCTVVKCGPFETLSDNQVNCCFDHGERQVYLKNAAASSKDMISFAKSDLEVYFKTENDKYIFRFTSYADEGPVMTTYVTDLDYSPILLERHFPVRINPFETDGKEDLTKPIMTYKFSISEANRDFQRYKAILQYCHESQLDAVSEFKGYVINSDLN